MNKQRKTSNILNVFQYDETTGAVTLPSTLVLTAPAGSDDSTKVPTTAWTRTYISSLTYATQSYVTTQINNLITGAPGALDTLDELAAALGDDANFASTITTSLSNRLRIDTAAQGLNSTQQGNARTNLGLGTAALSATGDFASAAQGTRADTAHGWGNHASAGYLTSATAATTYLSQTTASNTYLTLTNAASTYLSQTSAGNIYLTLTNAASTYLSQTSASNTYLTLTNAASTYLSQSSASSNYLTITNAASTYLTQTSASSSYVSLSGSYANPSWITSLAYSKITGVPAFLTSYTETDPFRVTSVAVSGTSTKTITLTRADSSTVSTSWTDIDTDTNTFASSLGFSGGTLTLTNNNASTVTVSLDGRYLQSYSETDTLATVTSRGNTTTGNISVNGNIFLTGTATTTNQARTIDFTGFDKEGVTDFSDRAYIQHTTNTGGHTGTVLVISSENDAEDGIAFLTNASSKLKHNSNNLATESYVTSQGYLTGITSSQVTNALGYTPYNSSNPSGYITSSSLSGYLPLTGGSLSGILTTNAQLAVADNIVIYGNNKQIQWNAAASADLFISAIPGTRTIEIRNGNAASPNYAACGLITGYATFTANVTVQGNLTVSSSNTTGNGIILADDGDIVDLNDAYCSMRFSYGVRIYSANRGGSPVITLANTGVVTASSFVGALSGNATTASSISGFNNPTTAATANTIVYRDGSGDVAAREFVLTASTIHVDTPSSMLGIYPTTNQVVKFGSAASRNFLNVPTRTGGDASGTWGISISGNANTSSYSLLDFRHSDRDFPSGTLVQTNINYAVSSGDAFILEIKGNSYFNTIPFDIQIQGYIYADTIISTGGYSNGKYIDGIRAINHNGNLCFWWPSGGYWEGFNVKVYAAFASFPTNRVTSITNSGLPTTNKQVNFAPVQSLHSGNFNSYAPSLTGGNASGTWGINITGSAATATDSTKLPLAGGTLTGNLLFANSGTTKRGIQGVCGDNDFWFIGGGATGSNSGFLEIATGDDGQSSSAEPIYVRQYGPGDVLTGTLVRTAALLDASGNTSFPGSLSIAGNTALHAGNFTSYTLPSGGGWYGVNTPGSRWGGFAVNGGEIAFGNGLPSPNQMGILIDGAYLAGENNGFWSLPSDNNWNGRRGMQWDGTYLNFTTNSAVGRFSGLLVDCGVATGRSGYAPGNLNIVLTSSSAGSDGICGIDFRSGNNYPSDGASIYYENSQTGSGEVSRLVIRAENDLNDSILLRAGYHVFNARTVDNASQGADNPVFRWQYLDSNRMTLDSSGNLVCNGDITAFSDARVKTDVKVIENSIEKVKSIRGVTFLRTDAEEQHKEKRHAGVIAQEILEVLPEVVTTDKEGMHSVAYGNLVALLIEGMKEQQTQIEELKNKLDLLTQNK
jgi:hypothetical protein